MRKSLGDVVIKNIKSISLLRPRLLKSLKSVIENYLKIKKTHLNITAIFSMHTPIIKIKSVRLYAEDLAVKL